FFRIGEVAGLVGVEPHVLRYWEREFRSIRPTKSAKGQRVYSRRDVENLLRVRDLLYRDGFTIAGAKKRLQTGSSAEPRDAEETAHEPDSSDPSQTEIVIAAAAHVDVDVAAPASSSSAVVDPREKLAALRAEVESFLEELEDRSEQGEPA
ncbi:MAG TPA: MerR family transcriptional regulator, partial [Labilithrix sp.]|nr:MerR family transcriptional regulator [Labilithrix sp.]